MLIFGLKVALIGLGIVFCTLVFLILVINVISAVTKAFESKVEVAEKKPDVVVDNRVEDIKTASQDDCEITAVFVAAITAYDQNSANIRTITGVTGTAAPSRSYAGWVETMGLR